MLEFCKNRNGFMKLLILNKKSAVSYSNKLPVFLHKTMYYEWQRLK